jgi:hypothetical protein
MALNDGVKRLTGVRFIFVILIHIDLDTTRE